jgi:hypothetical protein
MRTFICLLGILDMVFDIFTRINENVRRRMQRAFLEDPEKTPRRYALIMASVLLVSIIVTYNIQFERRKRKEG